MSNIRMVVFDVDGVITDGKRYIGNNVEGKTVSMKDLDAISLLHEAGYKVGCISGEDTSFCKSFSAMIPLDYVCFGCKTKVKAISEIGERFGFSLQELCYIGDGKYDIPVLELVGLGICPADAIDEVKRVTDVILNRRGGEGCIAECYTLLQKMGMSITSRENGTKLLSQRVCEHIAVAQVLLKDAQYLQNVSIAARKITDCYRNGNKLLLCGNGGSAADAQHLAAELVGRFYLERQALNAEALTTNTSILTALANDYSYDILFARQLEAKAAQGDVLIGLTTSGRSPDILKAFQKAREMGVYTILMTGRISPTTEVLTYTDCLLDVPSCDTPRIQEMHILIGHMICELVESELMGKEKIDTREE